MNTLREKVAYVGGIGDNKPMTVKEIVCGALAVNLAAHDHFGQRLDSLGCVEIKDGILTHYGVDVPEGIIFGSTIRQLETYVNQRRRER